MLQDKNGYFWLSNFRSKYKIASDNSTYTKLEGIQKENPNYFNAGITDHNDDLWMCSYGGLVWKYDGTTLTEYLLNTAGQDLLIITIYQDNAGVIWLGTDNDGVYRLQGEKFEKLKL